jgi:hypothetical protein
MDLSTMRTEARYIIGQTDTSNSDFTQAQLTAWANEFYRMVCVRLESLPITERSYTTGDTISLNANTIKVNQVKFKAQPSNKWIELEVHDIADLVHRDPDWENATDGVPDWFVFTGTFTARLYPPLDSSNDAQASGLKTYGLELPTALSADGDLPDLPYNIHDLFPHYMAYKAFTRLGDVARAGEQLLLVNTGLKAQRNVTVNRSDSKGFVWHDSDPGAYDCFS